MPSLFAPTSPLRKLVDLAWIVAFAVVMALLLRGGEGGQDLSAGVRLELIEGKQKRGLYLPGGARVGEMRQAIERRPKGWRVTERFFVSSGARPSMIGWSRVTLRKDLSLQTLAVSVDPSKLAGLTGLGPEIAKRLSLGRLTLNGVCRLATGNCNVSGSMGKQRISQTIAAGRGPVLPAALLPLLARGVLGNRAQLVVFDPLTLRRRVVVYQIVARRKRMVAGRLVPAILLKQDVEGMNSELWIDTRGRLIEETLPLGVKVKHEAWDF
jgi:hypothetical protein